MAQPALASGDSELRPSAAKANTYSTTWSYYIFIGTWSTAINKKVLGESGIVHETGMA